MFIDSSIENDFSKVFIFSDSIECTLFEILISVESGNIKLFFRNNNVKSVLCFDQIESNHVEIDNSRDSTLITDLMMLDGFKLIKRITE